MKERFYSIDVYKFIAALFIVYIHTVLFWNYDVGTFQWYTTWILMAIARNGVPLFFMMSAFLLYNHPDDRSLQQIKRLFTVYIAWCILTVPFIFYFYYQQLLEENYNYLHLLTFFLRQLFFTGFCGGGWFILTNIWCILIVRYFVRKSNFILLIVASVLYFLSIIDSSYYHLLGQGSLFNIFRNFFGSFSNFIPAGLLFFTIGKILAEHKSIISILNKHQYKLYVVTFFALLLNTTEVGFCIRLGYTGSSLRTDSTFTLPISACLLMLTSFTIKLKHKEIYYRLRNCSTIIYFIQFPLIWILLAIGIYGWDAYFLILTLAMIVSSMIFLLEKKIKILKFLY